MPREARARPTVGLALAACLASGASCTGAIESAPTSVPGGPATSARGDATNNPAGPVGPAPGGASAPSAPGLGSVTEPECAAVLPRRITRLLNRHYANAVRDLLKLPAAPSITGGGGGGQTLLAGEAERLTGALMFELDQTASQAAVTATAQLDAFLKCPAGSDEATCVRAFIDRFAARAFRRPTTAEERDKLWGVFTTGRAGEDGLRGGVELVIEAVLVSPSFLFRSELGTASAGGQFTLTPHELAAEVAFFLLDSLPDDGLWSAASDGRLGTPAGLEAEITRLLGLPAVRANVTRIFLSWLGSDGVMNVQKSSPDFTPALQADMQKETQLFVDSLLWKGGAKLGELLTSGRSWVDEPMARFYGLTYPGPKGGGFMEAMLPAGQRAGVLTQASMLAARADLAETSVVRRGAFIARELLCNVTPPPPPGIVDAAAATLKSLPTERARAEYRLATGSCSPCHSRMDPFGVTFENFDALGRYRTTVAGQAVDASWQLAYSPEITGPVKDALALAGRLASSTQVSACVVYKMASYAAGAALATEDACKMVALRRTFTQSGSNLVTLFHDIATWPALRVRQEVAKP